MEEESKETNWKEKDEKYKDNRSAVEILVELQNDPEAREEAKKLIAEYSC